MSTENHLITPPPELFAEWLAEAKRLHPNESLGFISGQIAQLAYRAGADQELEACCEWLDEVGPSAIPLWGNDLRKDRRPTPKRLAEQKQAIHDEIHQLLAQISANNAGALAVAEPIRAALERLRKLENGDD